MVVAASVACADDLLVTRNRGTLHLAGAEVVVAAAEAKPREMNLKVNVALVDDGGHLLAFARMEGARPATATTVLAKAVSAATFRQPTGPLPLGTTEPDLQLNAGVPAAAASSGGKMTSLYGGVPIEVDGPIFGAVGVGGATGAQDAEIVRAGIAELLEAIAAQKTK